ncbi:unnamed protein product [Ectocarpus sp. CCAP 1310/34]|nr:unnamed protein product [Ectocarpus sp. CCAP 1310/34]
MARLHRARMGHERYAECMRIVMLAAVCGVLGEEDLLLVVGACWVVKWPAFQELVAPTHLDGVRYDFMEVLGGFDFKELLRFEKPHFRRLVAALELPPEFVISGLRGGRGVLIIPAHLCLAVTLWRFSAPTTLLRDRLFWGMGETLVCEVFNVTIEAIYDRWGHLVRDLQVDAILPKIDDFCEATSSRGSPLPRCCGASSMAQFEKSVVLVVGNVCTTTTLLRDRLFWGMGETLVCEVFNVTIEAIYDRWGHLVRDLQVDAILPKIDDFCEATSSRGSPLPRCCGASSMAQFEKSVVLVVGNVCTT